ncbi:Fungal-trans domain-containing protein [Mycena venus]|uniref:Fungal-trans domain-containing protein n=1 Tax=Mycena venus TaxID=2733690 RepID=A0A8H7DBH7_9AGAR|nr:Fungal-trans domain-containing protein [Mycena venus]
MKRQGSGSRSSEGYLIRDKCSNCRRRKIKCDAERPRCGPCSRSKIFEDCEYPEDGPTKTQILEDQISIIEGRIQELETPKALKTTPLPNNPSGSGSRSLTLSSSFCRSLRSGPSGTPSEGVPWVELESLIQNFLLHASQFGFFLNVHRFSQSILNGNGPSPTPILLDVISLCAIHFSNSNWITYEPTYFARALSSAADALSGTHSQNTVLHSIQAAVLLSQYFAHNARFLEAKCRLGAAVSLALGSGLHRIRSLDSSSVRNSTGRTGSGRQLSPPRDVIEEAEHINALWTVLTLDSCWTIADGSPSNIPPDVRIDSPWPLDINSPDFHSQIMLLPDTSFGTVTAFLAGLPDSGSSVSALHAKAAILFEQASRLAARYRSDTLTAPMPRAHAGLNNYALNQFYISFNTVDTLIEAFKLNIPPTRLHPTREILVIQSLAQAATIQLHNPFVGEGDASRLRVLDAAHAIVGCLELMPVNEFVFMNPIMGTLLMATCQVFIAELTRLRRHRHRAFFGQASGEHSIMNAIDMVLAVMSVFAPRCQIMDSQLRAVQQLYQGV